MAKVVITLPNGGGGTVEIPHNQLDGLQGSGPDYYHLNQEQYNNIINPENQNLQQTLEEGSTSLVDSTITILTQNGDNISGLENVPGGNFELYKFDLNNGSTGIGINTTEEGIRVFDEQDNIGFIYDDDYANNQILNDNAIPSTLGVKKLIKNTVTLKKVEYPVGLSFRPFNIYEINGSYTVSLVVDFLIKDKISKMKPYYVNYQTGSNSNNGLTESTAFKTIAVAYANGARLIYLTGGIHKIDSWSLLNSAYTNTDDCFIIGKGKEPNIVCSAPAITPTITLQSGTTYQATDANIRLVVDMKYLDSYGFPLKLTEYFSITDVNNNNGSYYYDTTSNILYFNLLDNRVPDNDVLLLTRLRNAEYRANAGYHYVENITFMGGGSTTGTHGVVSQTGVGSTLISLNKNCRFIYGQALTYTANGGEGTRALYNKISWYEDCIAYNNARDGFNYLSDVSNPMNFIEVNCQSFDNDWRKESNNSNGSSFHGPGNGIRIGGKYYRNSGPNVADVDGAVIFNVGCVTGESTASLMTGTTYNVDFAVESNIGLGPTKMFLYDCRSINENKAYSITGTQSSYIYVHPSNSNRGGTQIITPSAPQEVIRGEYTTDITTNYIFPSLSSFVENTGIVSQTITNGVTTTAPSEDAVFDALALKAPINNAVHTGTFTIPTGSLSVTGGSTSNYFRGDGSIAGFASGVRTTTVSSTVTATTPVAVGTSFDNAVVLLQNQVNLKLNSSSILTGSATLDFPSTAPGTSSELSFTVTGAADGDVVSVGIPNGSTFIDSCYTARVSATDTVTIKFNNYSAVAKNPASGVFKVKIFK